MVSFPISTTKYLSSNTNKITVTNSIYCVNYCTIEASPNYPSIATAIPSSSQILPLRFATMTAIRTEAESAWQKKFKYHTSNKHQRTTLGGIPSLPIPNIQQTTPKQTLLKREIGISEDQRVFILKEGWKGDLSVSFTLFRSYSVFADWVLDNFEMTIPYPSNTQQEQDISMWDMWIESSVLNQSPWWIEKYGTHAITIDSIPKVSRIEVFFATKWTLREGPQRLSVRDTESCTVFNMFLRLGKKIWITVEKEKAETPSIGKVVSSELDNYHLDNTSPNVSQTIDPIVIVDDSSPQPISIHMSNSTVINFDINNKSEKSEILTNPTTLLMVSR